MAVSSVAQASAFTRDADSEQSDASRKTETPSRIQLPELSYRTDTDTNAFLPVTAPIARYTDLIQIRYLVRMPESEAAIQHRNEPDEYGEIISHGPIEMGVWQPRLETEGMRAQGQSGKIDNIHHDEWKP